MRRRAARRSVVAAGAALVVATGLSPLAGQAAADTPAAAVLAPYGASVDGERVFVAGRTGFLHAATTEVGHYLWTDYSTGESTPFTLPAGAGGIINTHGDTVAYATGTAGEIGLADPVAGTSRTLRLPAGLTLATVLGETLVAYGDGQCHLLRADADGVLSDRTVTGLPEGARCTTGGVGLIPSFTSDGASAVVRYTSATEARFGLVDLDSARFTALPTPANVIPQRLRISPQAIAWYDAEAKAIQVVPRVGAGQRWSVPASSNAVQFELAGSRLLWKNATNGPVTAVSPDGTATRVLDLAESGGAQVVPGPDGTVLLFGRKTTGGDYAVHRFTEAADGTLTDDAVLTAPWHPTRTGSLALAQGRLATVDTYLGGNPVLHERKLALTGSPQPVTKENLGPLGQCGAAGCPVPYPTGDGRVLYQATDSTYRLIDQARPAPGTTVQLDEKGTVQGVSGRYVVYRTATATEIRDLDTGKVVRSGAASAAGLWGGTLWRPAGAGKVSATDVASGTVTRTLSIGASCGLGSVQASARYVYWECSTPADGAGVVTLADGTARRLTATGHGLLGDGSVSYVGADRTVRVTDVTAATPTTRTLGTARGGDAGRDWTADPTGDRVAFVDDDENVHVVPTGITASPLAQTDAAVPASARVMLEGSFWKPRWWISKPVASWTLTLKNKVTGKAVTTLRGGEARDAIKADWDGSVGSGLPGAADASYTWTLTAQPADGQGAALTKSGTVAISGARPAHHDMTGRDGFGDLLTMNSSGAFTYQHGTGQGTFSGKTSASGWPTGTTAVPFGDLTWDDDNETLVRTTGGELRSYRTGGGALKTTTSYIKLGTGWNAYNVLTSPGDLTGDGRPDLLARKSSTGDIYVFAGKSDGTLAAGKKIRSAWTTYTHIVGVGDLNGDGIGDVLARRTDGTLFRYDGAGDGTLKDRVTVFTDWGSTYKTIVGVGDITGDGKNDLVVRDTSGNLYRNDGKGNGSFTSRTKIASGWSTYKGVF
ncbi:MULTISPECIES: VCBS repeat-containing protein [unclassified Streptomyces]|uniref:FG-GAP repeat domain-containing protein n=1 Tax=unclassified Streptomyces TaxID=2593676 RepID=UPI000DB92C60|nr:VCBS repeat-containing protein [Streptomyces sp. PsTaAH-137]MYT73026.1 VCBS repeat-containing protein [Streptomyces sp. SID8367]RAJ73822.1 VCBS repeat protein [Streptomyces sp. PsTaAH-137]